MNGIRLSRDAKSNAYSLQQDLDESNLLEGIRWSSGDMKAGSSVDDYIARQPEAAQAVLVKVRAAIRKALPQAEELLSYNIPTYKEGGKAVLYFAGWKRHYSLYPATRGVLEEFASELRPYEVSKGTIRLPLDEPVPVRLIGRIAKFRAAEVAVFRRVHQRQRQ